jgi:hypothetical protein
MRGFEEGPIKGLPFPLHVTLGNSSLGKAVMRVRRPPAGAGETGPGPS